MKWSVLGGGELTSLPIFRSGGSQQACHGKRAQLCRGDGEQHHCARVGDVGILSSQEEHLRASNVRW